MRAPYLHIVILTAFLMNTFGPCPSVQAQEFHLPVPGVLVHLSPEFNPPILKGIKVNPDDPFRFEFILDKGDNLLRDSSPLAQNDNDLKLEATKLIKYFLASLTVPEKDLWVNLSPYEKNRIIPQGFGLTEMGRDLLVEDYMLKQITASLIYPEDATGKRFWKRIYEEAAKKFGTTNVPVNTFNKVWIVPEKAVVYENAQAGTAYVVESRLKVMLEQDYLSMQKHADFNLSSPNVSVGDPEHEGTRFPIKAFGNDSVAALGSQIIREIVIPELNREVNEDKNFAQLRQVYNSLILANWYKKKIKDSILAQVYEDENKVAGVQYGTSVILSATKGPKKINSLRDSSPVAQNDAELIYHRYIQAFKKGAYNYIKEETDPLTQEIIPRKYFSGGLDFDGAQLAQVERFTANQSVLTDFPTDLAMVSAKIQDAAMSSKVQSVQSLGSRKHQEDEFLINEEFKLSESLHAMHNPDLKGVLNREGHLMAVFDGHSRSGQSGGEIVGVVKEELPGIFGQQLLNYRGDVEKSLKGTFSRLHALTKDYTAGTTVTIVYIPHGSNKIYYAVLGDSPLFVVKKDGSFELAPMHTLENFQNNSEVRRIQKYFERHDGNIEPMGIFVPIDGKEKSSKVPRALGSVELGRVILKTPDVGVLETKLEDVKALGLGSDGILKGTPLSSRESIVHIVDQINSGKSAEDIINDEGNNNDDNRTLVLWHPDMNGSGAEDHAMLGVDMGDLFYDTPYEQHVLQYVQDLIHGNIKFDPDQSGTDVARQKNYLKITIFGKTFAKVYDLAIRDFRASMATYGYPMSQLGFAYRLMAHAKIEADHRPRLNYDWEIDNFVFYHPDFLNPDHSNVGIDRVEYLLGYQTYQFKDFYARLLEQRRQGVLITPELMEEVRDRFLKDTAYIELNRFISKIKNHQIKIFDWNDSPENMAHQNKFYNFYFIQFLGVLLNNYALAERINDSSVKWEPIIAGISEYKGTSPEPRTVGVGPGRFGVAGAKELSQNQQTVEQLMGIINAALNDLDLKNAERLLLYVIEAYKEDITSDQEHRLGDLAAHWDDLTKAYGVTGEKPFILRDDGNVQDFQTLGIDKKAITEDDLKSFYRPLMRKNHPDAGGDEEISKRLNLANEALGKKLDEKKRNAEARSIEINALGIDLAMISQIPSRNSRGVSASDIRMADGLKRVIEEAQVPGDTHHFKARVEIFQKEPLIHVDIINGTPSLNVISFAVRDGSIKRLSVQNDQGLKEQLRSGLAQFFYNLLFKYISEGAELEKEVTNQETRAIFAPGIGKNIYFYRASNGDIVFRHGGITMEVVQDDAGPGQINLSDALYESSTGKSLYDAGFNTGIDLRLRRNIDGHVYEYDSMEALNEMLDAQKAHLDLQAHEHLGAERYYFVVTKGDQAMNSGALNDIYNILEKKLGVNILSVGKWLELLKDRVRQNLDEYPDGNILLNSDVGGVVRTLIDHVREEVVRLGRLSNDYTSHGQDVWDYIFSFEKILKASKAYYSQTEEAMQRLGLNYGDYGADMKRIYASVRSFDIPVDGFNPVVYSGVNNLVRTLFTEDHGQGEAKREVIQAALFADVGMYQKKYREIQKIKTSGFDTQIVFNKLMNLLEDSQMNLTDDLKLSVYLHLLNLDQAMNSNNIDLTILPMLSKLVVDSDKEFVDAHKEEILEALRRVIQRRRPREFIMASIVVPLLIQLGVEDTRKFIEDVKGKAISRVNPSRKEIPIIQPRQAILSAKAQETITVEKVSSMEDALVQSWISKSAHYRTTWDLDGPFGKRALMVAKNSKGEAVGAAIIYQSKKGHDQHFYIDALEAISGDGQVEIQKSLLRSVIAQRLDGFKAGTLAKNPSMELLRVKLFEVDGEPTEQIDFYRSLGFNELRYRDPTATGGDRYAMTITVANAQRLVQSLDQAMNGDDLREDMNRSEITMGSEVYKIKVSKIESRYTISFIHGSMLQFNNVISFVVENGQIKELETINDFGLAKDLSDGLAFQFYGLLFHYVPNGTAVEKVVTNDETHSYFAKNGNDNYFYNEIRDGKEVLLFKDDRGVRKVVEKDAQEGEISLEQALSETPTGFSLLSAGFKGLNLKDSKGDTGLDALREILKGEAGSTEVSQSISVGKSIKYYFVVTKEDKAQLSNSPTGGIDLSSDKSMTIQHEGQGIKFHIDPVMLSRLRNAPGFTPVIINIRPMTDVRAFLGLKKGSQAVVG